MRLESTGARTAVVPSQLGLRAAQPLTGNIISVVLVSISQVDQSRDSELLTRIRNDMLSLWMLS